MQIRDTPGLEYSVVHSFLCSFPKSHLPGVGESGFPELWGFSQGSWERLGTPILNQKQKMCVLPELEWTGKRALLSLF